MMKSKFLFLFLLLGFLCKSQKETNKWYFGIFSGMQFTNFGAVTLNNNVMNAGQGSSCISDNNGNPFFFTDGMTIWNSQQIIMPNGSGLLGFNSTVQGVVIAKQPENSNKYFVFTNSGFVYPYNNGLKYSVVDMSLASGTGSVILKNTIVDSTIFSPRIVATNHCNGKDVWILVHEWATNNFKAFLLTSTGLNTTPVITNISFSGSSFLSQMKFISNGKRLGVASNTQFDLYDFDNSTGILSNHIMLPADPQTTGCEFSPDGKYFYGASNSYSNNYPTSKLYQWDLCAGSVANILASKYTLSTNIGTKLENMQLAKDGKIYIAGIFNNWSQGIGVINYPNLPGASCQFSINQSNLFSISSCYGLPNFNSSLFNSSTTPPSYTINQVESCQSVTFSAIQTDLSSGCASVKESLINFQWDFGDIASGNSNFSNLHSPSHLFTNPGNYTVNLNLNYSCRTETVTTIVTIAGPTPQLTISATSSVICLGETLEITASGAISYVWDNDSTYPIIYVSPTTTTTYSVLGAIGECSSSAIFEVSVDQCLHLSELHSGSLKLKITPNPAKDVLHVNAQNRSFADNTSIEIVDQLGKILSSVVIDNSTNKNSEVIHVDALENGLYIVRIKQGELIHAISKFIKN